MEHAPVSPPGARGVRAGRLAAALLLAVLAVPPAPARAQDNAAAPLSFYVDHALADNPSLSAMQERIRMKESAAARAAALDDPKGWIGITSVPVNSWSFREEDMTGKEIGLSQMLPFPGKRKLKTEIATREKEQTEFDLQEMRNMLRSEVKMAYAELSFVQRQADVIRRSREVLGEVISVSQEMYAVGKATQADVHRAQVEFGKMREMLLVLENREAVLGLRLNTLAALPPGRPVPKLPELPELGVTYSRDRLLSAYMTARPARKALEARILRGDASVAMARREYYPDFEVSASYMQRDAMPDGTRRPDMFSSMVLVNLPVWRSAKLEPQVREMTAEREMARRELANLDLESGNAIGNALATMENRASVAALYRTSLIPHAETAFETALSAYRVGKVDFPMLMDAIMNVLSLRKDYQEMVGDQFMQKARLEAAVGKELD